MKSYLVVWRDNGDDFYVTRLDFEESYNVDQLQNQDWVTMAADAENLDQSEWNVSMGYDLIEIVGGENFTFHMK